jgi:hypothetical protein
VRLEDGELFGFGGKASVEGGEAVGDALLLGECWAVYLEFLNSCSRQIREHPAMRGTLLKLLSQGA